jgi:hypothetical protein
VRGELRVEMKTCQLNTAGAFPKSFSQRCIGCGAATRTTTHVTHRNCQLLHTYTAEHSSDAPSQCTKESLFNMTPPLCYANPDCPSTHHLPLIPIMHRPGSQHAKHTYAKPLVYPVICNTSMCHSVLSRVGRGMPAITPLGHPKRSCNVLHTG